jgi:hypothetical protein
MRARPSPSDDEASAAGWSATLIDNQHTEWRTLIFYIIHAINYHLSKLRGKAMATIDILSLIGKGEINKAQRDHLTKELRARRRKLLDAIKKVDQGLKALARKSKSKRRKKR